MTDSVNSFVQRLGIDYKSVKKLDVENEKNPEVAAKYAALQNHGNELVIKDDDSFYLVELKDSVKLNELATKIPKNSKSIIAINFTETEGAGALYTPETLSGPTLLDKGKAIITSKREDESKGFRIGNGYFKAELTDINGFSNNSKNDINLKVNGTLKITTEDLTRYLNEEVKSKDSNLNLTVKENGDDWKLNINFKPETKQEIRNKIREFIIGQDGSFGNKIGKQINLDKAVDRISENMVNGIEKRLGMNLSKEKISSILTGKADAKQEVPKLMKQGINKEFIQIILKEEAGDYEAYIPDYAFGKASEYIEKKVNSYIDENYSKESLIDAKMFVNDLKETLGYSLSDTELESLTTVVKSNIKGNELEMNLFINGDISSDIAKEKYTGKTDSIKVQGAFELTSKGKAEMNGAHFNTDAALDTTKINKATIVSMAESLGSKGEKINTELVGNKRKINIQGDAEFSNVNEGLYSSYFNIQNFSEDNFGTSIKAASGYFNVDANTPGHLKLNSMGKVTVEEATLLSNFKISPNETVEKFTLKKPANSKESVNIDRMDMEINNDGAVLHTEGISTGIDFNLKKDKKDISVEIKQVDLKAADFKLNFKENKEILFNGSGNNLKFSGIKVLSGKDNLQIDQISVAKGKGKVELGKTGEFNAEGSGVKVDNLKVMGLTANVVTEGLSKISSAKGSLHISGPVFKGNVKFKDEKLEFVCDKGNIDISPSGNKITYRAGAEEAGTFTLKSGSRDISAKLILPKGSKAEVDLKNNTLKLTGKNGKEIEAQIKLTSYSGNPIGDFKVQSAEPVNATLGKALEIKTSSTVNISGSFKAKNEDISFNGKFHGNVKYENNNLTYTTSAENPESIEIEAKGKKFNLEAVNKADLSVDFSEGETPVNIKVGDAAAPVNLKFKVSDTGTGKVDAELEANLLNKAELGFSNVQDGDNKNISLKITPPSADKIKGNSGISIKGSVNTPQGMMNINQLNISGVTDANNNTKSSNLTISEKGLNFRDSELSVDGSISLDKKNITFKGDTLLKNATLDFSDKSVVINNAAFKGKINDLNVKVEGGLDGKKREATYTGAVSNGKETIRLNGNVAFKENNSEILSLSGRTSIALTEGNLKPAYFIAGMKDFTVYKTDPNKIISGNMDISSAKVADNKIFSDKNLVFSGNFSLDKTASGYAFNLSNADLSSQDSLKTVVAQISGVLKQPHISAELAKKGINATDIDNLQKELYKSLITKNLKTTSDVKVNFSKDFEVKDLSFKAKVDSIDMSFPIIRHTKDKGFSLEAKPGEKMYKLNQPVSISGKMTDSTSGKNLNTKVNVNLNEILPNLIEQQFNSPESPLKGKMVVKLEGDKIRITDAKSGYFSHISFGLKDVDIKVADNKVEVKLKIELLRALYDSVKFALSDDLKIKREWETFYKIYTSTGTDFKLSDILKLNQISVSLPEIVDQNTPLQIDGDIKLKDGNLEIPLKTK